MSHAVSGNWRISEDSRSTEPTSQNCPQGEKKTKTEQLCKFCKLVLGMKGDIWVRECVDSPSWHPSVLFRILIKRCLRKWMNVSLPSCILFHSLLIWKLMDVFNGIFVERLLLVSSQQLFTLYCWNNNNNNKATLLVHLKKGVDVLYLCSLLSHFPGWEQERWRSRKWMGL